MTTWAYPSTHGIPTYDEWTNPTNIYASDDVYATVSTEGFIQDLGGFSFIIAPAGSGKFYEVDAVYAELEGASIGLGTSMSIGVKLSWDAGVSWSTQYVLGWTNAEGEVTKQYTQAQSSSGRLSWGRNWKYSELSTANLRARLTLTRKTGANIFNADGFRLGVDIHVCRNVGGPGHFTHSDRIIGVF